MRLLPAPAGLLAGGEAAVGIGYGPAGHGGRNTEFLLALALPLAGRPGFRAISGHSDGSDEMDDVPGVILAPDPLA